MSMMALTFVSYKKKKASTDMDRTKSMRMDTAEWGKWEENCTEGRTSTTKKIVTLPLQSWPITKEGETVFSKLHIFSGTNFPTCFLNILHEGLQNVLQEGCGMRRNVRLSNSAHQRPTILKKKRREELGLPKVFFGIFSFSFFIFWRQQSHTKSRDLTWSNIKRRKSFKFPT